MQLSDVIENSWFLSLLQRFYKAHFPWTLHSDDVEFTVKGTFKKVNLEISE